VIIADDHPVVRMGFAELLAWEADIEVVAEAETGEQAVALARELNPQVVMMDLSMPGRGGVWAIEQILAHAAPNGGPKILVVTVFESDARIKQALSAGAAEYIIKACQPGEVVAAVRRVATGQPELSKQARAALESKGYVLSNREAQALRLAARGLSNPEIAVALMVAESTVKTLLARAYTKLDASDRAHAVARAIAEDLI